MVVITLCAAQLCAALFATKDIKPRSVQTRTCETIVTRSLDDGLNPTTMISIAWYESAFYPKVKSKAGAIGPLQVLPRYWCPKKGKCDLIAAGFKAFRAFKKNRSLKETLCRYNSGRSCKERPLAMGYSKRVRRLKKKLDENFPLLCGDDGC